jgi:hypothetical protein
MLQSTHMSPYLRQISIEFHSTEPNPSQEDARKH